jgi:hypothetical protein
LIHENGSLAGKAEEQLARFRFTKCEKREKREQGNHSKIFFSRPTTRLACLAAA